MDNEKLFTLIKSPIITEQTAILGEKLTQVVFKVDLSANKRDIKKAIANEFAACELIKEYNPPQFLTSLICSMTSG